MLLQVFLTYHSCLGPYTCTYSALEWQSKYSKSYVLNVNEKDLKANRNNQLRKAFEVKFPTWTFRSQGLTAVKLSATVTSYINTTPSALQKNCLVMLRNLRKGWNKLGRV